MTDAKHTYSQADLDAIRDRFTLSSIVGQRVTLKKRGNRHWGLCPFHNEGTASFTVRDDRRIYECFGCGAFGDVIDWVMWRDQLRFPEAVAKLLADGGLDDPKAREEAAARERRSRQEREAADAQRAQTDIGRCDALWKSGHAAGGTLAETYLWSRGICLAPPPALRFVASLAYWDDDVDAPPKKSGEQPLIKIGAWPAMIGAVRHWRGAFVGLHVTWLRPDGTDKAEIIHPQTGQELEARKMRGRCWGGAVALTPPGVRMGFAEGIETALSVMQMQPGLPVWALLSLGNFPGGWLGRGAPHPTKPRTTLPTKKPDPARPAFIPPAICRDATWCADSDDKDRATSDALIALGVARWQSLRLTARVARAAAGKDFNDMVRGKSGDPLASD